MTALKPWALCVAALLICGDVFAEVNCPPGYYQTGATDFVGCAPLPGAAGAAATHPGLSWSSRWGAIATASGAFGTANNVSSARKAEKMAMKQCRANGGKNCRVNLSFSNQCVALAWGNTFNSAKYATDIAQAETMAMNSCSRDTQNCKVFYSACSYSERIR
jgi:hypothetical protein